MCGETPASEAGVAPDFAQSLIFLKDQIFVLLCLMHKISIKKKLKFGLFYVSIYYQMLL